MSEDTTPTISPEEIAATGATGVAPDAPAKAEPKNIQELVAAIDISGISEHEIIVDLIAGIQQLAVRGTIALGLLERLAKAQEDAAETPAE